MTSLEQLQQQMMMAQMGGSQQDAEAAQQRYQMALMQQQQNQAGPQKQAGGGVNGTGQVAQTSYYAPEQQNKFEAQAGVGAPQYDSILGTDGAVKSPFAVDPTKSDAFNQLYSQATSQNPSMWAQLQLQNEQLGSQNLMDQASKQSESANAQAQAGLMRFGGMGGGARTSLAKSSQRDLLNAQQQVGRNSLTNQLGINAQDAQNKQGLMQNAAQVQLAGQESNINAARGDITGKQTFDTNRYTQQMQAWGANQTANAQRAAASQSGKK